MTNFSCYTVQVFFKKHPRREEIGASDRIEILQMETRGRLLEQEVLKHFKQHTPKLVEELKVSELLPFLQSQHVLSVEEAEELSRESSDRQSEMLLKCIGEKTPFWIVRFAECLKESPENKRLSELLLPGKMHRLANAVRGRERDCWCIMYGYYSIDLRCFQGEGHSAAQKRYISDRPQA